MAKTPIKKAVMAFINTRIAEKEEEFRVGSLKIADETSIAIDNIIEEGDNKTEALATKCVEDIIGNLK